jgi:hypothetical protein
MLVSFRASRRRVEESHSLPTEIPPSGRFEIPRLRRRFARASLGMTHSSGRRFARAPLGMTHSSGRRFARAPLGMTKFLESPSARSE